VKTVHSSDMVAHLWAHQSQAIARNSGSSFSFDGPVCYSYQTPIAMLHDTAAGRIALITSDGYSITTKSKHLSPIWRALHGHIRSFRVPCVGATGGRAPYVRLTEAHVRNVAHLVDEYAQLGARIRRARDSYHADAESVRNALEGAALIVRDYCEAFGLDVPELDPADDARVIWTARTEREAKANDPKQVAKRQRAREQAAARKEAREAAERAERYQREAEARLGFRAGTYRGWVRVSDERGGALLRFDAADDTIRTSYGAEVPAEHARRAYPLIVRVRERGETWRPNGHTLHFGTFAANEISADGTLRVGCHTIHWPEIEACARALGLTE
jgi:hypothetical protein